MEKTVASGVTYPKLRPIDVQAVMQDGQPYLLLRDPLGLTDKVLLIPQGLGGVLSLCDGTRENASALSISLMIRYGQRVGVGMIAQLLAALDEALLLENDTFVQAHEQALSAYHQAPARAFALAGHSYPAEADELRHLLDDYLKEVASANEEQYSDQTTDGTAAPPVFRGLVSPHIDYARGGLVYAKVWKKIAESAKAAELVVILGTDHYGENGRLTLTRQNYATPFGVLPTAQDMVDTLAKAIGEDAAFADELHHRGEHSIELAATWLHYIREGQPCELLPILCGSFDYLIHDGVEPEQDSNLQALIAAFRTATEGRQVLVVAAGDLAHVGPAFGGPALDAMGRDQLKAEDQNLITQMSMGDANGFLGEIRRVSDRNNVCGVPPIYLALQFLHPTQGETVAYKHCPADEDGTSVVSICGTVFT